MRRRVSLYLACSLITAACNGATAATTTAASSTTVATTTSTTTTSTTTTSTTTTSTTTTTTLPPTTSTLPPDPQFALLFDGFEHLGRLGDDAEEVLTTFGDLFGEPTSDSDWREEHGCSFEGPVRTVIWIDPGVRLTFGDGASVFADSGPHLVTYSTMLPVETSWRFFGVHRGMYVTDLEIIFPEAQVLEGSGLDYVQFDPEVLAFAWVDSSGSIRDFWGGDPVCGG